MKLISVIALICSTQALAGFAVGTGGFGIQCQPETPRLADYWTLDSKFKSKLNRKIISSSIKMSVEWRIEQVEKIFAELAKEKPNLANQLSSHLSNFKDLFRFAIEEEFSRKSPISTDDYEYIEQLSFKDDCEVVQLAARWGATLDDTNATYALNLAHWENLSALDQVGLIIHEVAHTQFNKDPKKVAKLNQYIITRYAERKHYELRPTNFIF